MKSRVALLALGTAAMSLAWSTLAAPVAAQGSWTLLPGASPSQRRAAAVGAINGYLYAAGGAAPGSTSSVATAEKYDLATSTWSALPALPSATQQAAGAAAGGRFYVICGGSCCAPSSAVQIYDPATGAWTTGPSSPYARYGPRAAELNGVIYVLGGASGFGTAYPNLDVLDPATGWSARPSMPSWRNSFGFAASGGRLYALGGTDFSGTPMTTNFVFDPALNSWSTRAPLPFPMVGCAAFVVNGVIYLAGADNGGLLTKVLAYDPATDAWTERAPMATVLYSRQGAAAGNTGYVVGEPVTYPASSPLRVEAFSAAAYPGMNDDLTLKSGINGAAPATGLGRNVRSATATSTLTLRIESPFATFDFRPVLLVAEAFPTGSPPVPLAPNVWMDASLVFVIGTSTSPLGAMLLPPGGLPLSFVVPPGLSGTSVLFQAAALSPLAINGVFGATEAHEIQIR